MKRVISITAILAVTVAISTSAWAQGGRGGQRGGRGGAAPRDTARTAPTGTGVIAGRVLTADTARPIKRARGGGTGGGGWDGGGRACSRRGANGAQGEVERAAVTARIAVMEMKRFKVDPRLPLDPRQLRGV